VFPNPLIMRLRYLLTVLLALVGLQTMATHMSGGEIYWECIGPNTYRIRLVVYRDCAGINVDPSYNLLLTSPCGNRTLTVTTPGGVEISQLCDLELPNSTCNGGTLPGIQQYEYTGTIILPPCNSWSVRWTNIYRNNAIVNLTNPGTREMFIEAVMNTATAPCNDSPVFTNTAIPYVCLGYPVSFSYGAVDPEADSLSYALIGARMAGGAAIPYVVPFSGANPIPGIVLNPATGLITFTLNTAGNWVVVVRVTSYNSAGQVIGTVMRDMQFVAYPCDNIPPDAATGLVGNLTGNAVQTGPRAVEVCESGDFCFDMVINDANLNNVLTAFSNIQQNLPGATFTYSGTNPITVNVCWTALSGTSGFFPFIVNVNDGACPIPAFQTYVYSVRVLPGVHGIVTAIDESCVGAGDGSLSATVTSGVGPYTYAWNTGASTQGITGPPGDYSVHISATNGCTSHLLPGTIGTTYPPTVNAGPDATVCAEDIPVQLNGTYTNATTANWSGGSGNWYGSGATAEYVPTSAEIQAGSVQLVLTTVTTGCPPVSDLVTISFTNSFIGGSIQVTDASCYELNDGSATYSPALPGFTYVWDDPLAQTSATATSLAPGLYTLAVTDAFGCTHTLPAMIGPAEPLSAVQVTVVDESCPGMADGSATVSISGGAPPYSFEWNTGVTESTLYGGAGDYSVTIADLNGCAPALVNITIGTMELVHAVDAGADQVVCMDALPVQLNGTVTNAPGFTWSGGSELFTQMGNTVLYMPSSTDIANGSVLLTLSSVSTNGCPPATDELLLTFPNSFANGAISATDASCYELSDGSASFAPADPTFTYSWNDPGEQSTALALNLAPGTYMLTVTDLYGCNVQLAATIGPAEPLSNVQVSVSDESCLGAGDGSATVSVTGGAPPYSYAWSTGSSEASIQAGSGTYTVSISDNNGCAPAVATVTIGAAAYPATADAGVDQVVCMDALPVQLTGSFTNAADAIWSGGSELFDGTGPVVTYTPSTTDIAAGGVTLTLTTISNTGCPPATDEVVLTIPNSFANGVVSTTDATCYELSNGSATFSPALPGFTFLWNDPNTQLLATATDLAPGAYTVTVTDIHDCSSIFPAVIGPAEPLSIADLVVTDESCLGSGDGSVTALATGGTQPFAYLWNTGSTSFTIAATSGAYTVSITDANGCAPVTGNATVAAQALPNAVDAGPDQLVCMDDLQVQVTGLLTNAPDGVWSGGTGTFTGSGVDVTYLPSAADVAAGSVLLTLTSVGNTNCPEATDAMLVQIPNSFANGTVNTTDATCYELSNGSASFSPANAGFSFSWNDPQAQSTALATGLAPGNYILTVTDAHGCSAPFTAFIGPAEALTIAALTSTNEGCLGNGDGSAMVSVNGGTAPYAYSWNTGATTPQIMGTAGSYTVSISDANGCAPVSGQVQIQATGIPNVVDAGPDAIVCMNQYPIPLNGSVQNADGGIWSGGNGVLENSGTSVSYWPTLAEIISGGVDLVLTSTGNPSCPPVSDTLHIALSNAFLNAEIAVQDIPCQGLANGSIHFTPVDPSLTYTWSHGPTGAEANDLAPGTYTLVISDALGCDTSYTATISEPAALVIASLNHTNVTCPGGATGQATVASGGGTQPHAISWSNGTIGAVASGLTAGAHVVTITDAHGCEVQGNVVVLEPEAIVLQADIPDTVCVNSPVVLTATASGGTGALQVQWIGLGTGTSITTQFGASQNVSVTVTDSAGCTGPTLTVPVTVLDLDLATFATYGDTVICAGQSVTVGASVSGYPGGYTLSWPGLGTTGPGPFTFPLNTSTNLEVVLTNACGDQRNETITLQVDVPVVVNLPQVIAQGCAPLTVQFPNLPLTNVSWSWNLGNGQTSSAAAPLVVYQAGTYTATLTVTTAAGCTSNASSSGQIIAHQSPTAAFSASPWSTDLDNALISFTNQSSGNITSYSWNFGDGGTSAFFSPQHQYTDIGQFQVDLYVVDINGCTANTTHVVEITPVYDITLPNAFTPGTGGGNGGGWSANDLSNDVFYAFVRNVKDFRMRIFNRWGELIFESTDVLRGWDGYYRDQLSPQDVYVVQTWVRFLDGREIQKLTDLTLFR
jgi:PKD repeat protein/dTDP-4-dehydrorhamnose 3,5-epimerase-like enzyme